MAARDDRDVQSGPSPASTAATNLREAERGVIGALLLGSLETVARAAILLTPRDFYYKAHQEMFAAAVALQSRGVRPDSITLTGELAARGAVHSESWPVAIADVLATAATTANLEAHAAMVREAAARRRARDEARRLATALEDPTRATSETLSSAVAALTRANEQASPDAARDAILSQVLTDQQLMAVPPEPIDSVVGEGLVIKAGLAILASHSGLGKTYLAMQLMQSMALGAEWLGFHCPRGRAGLLELEMPTRKIYERMHAGRGARLEGRTEYLIMPSGLGYLTDPAACDHVIAWCQRSRLDLLVIDPLHAIHEGDENKADAVSRLMDALARLRARSGTAVLLLHHVNKMQVDPKLGLRTSVLLSLRGHGRLSNDPDTVVGMVEHTGQLLLVFAKTRHCHTEESLALRQSAENGYFTASPSARAERRASAQQIWAALEEAGPAGMTVLELMKRTGLSIDTVTRNLTKVEAVSLRDGHAKRWFLSEHRYEGETMALSDPPERNGGPSDVPF